MQLLEQPLVRGVVAKPLLTTTDQRLVVCNARIIDIVLPTQSNGDGVLFGIGRVAFEQIIGPNCDRDLLALVYVDYWKSFDFNQSNTLELGDALRPSYIGRKKKGCHRTADDNPFLDGVPRKERAMPAHHTNNKQL